MFHLFIVLTCLISLAVSEVVVLDTSNFEHLTQASTGSTTGDWLVKFYAPWCGHCKKLEPILDEVAKALDGEINVAKVDVTQNRELGTRFDIKGFPTLKFLSKGKIYTFKGRRSVNEIVEFVRGGFQIHEAEEVPKPLGFLGEIVHVYRHAYKTATSDLRNGKYFTVDVFLTFMPVLFLILLVLVLLIPTPSANFDEETKKRFQQQQRQQQHNISQAVDSSNTDAPASSGAKKDE